MSDVERAVGAAAVVTGGATGIGFACAGKLLERGFSVLICGRRARVLEEAIAALEAAGAPGGVAGIQAEWRSISLRTGFEPTRSDPAGCGPR